MMAYMMAMFVDITPQIKKLGKSWTQMDKNCQNLLFRNVQMENKKLKLAKVEVLGKSDLDVQNFWTEQAKANLPLIDKKEMTEIWSSWIEVTKFFLDPNLCHLPVTPCLMLQL